MKNRPRSNPFYKTAAELGLEPAYPASVDEAIASAASGAYQVLNGLQKTLDDELQTRAIDTIALALFNESALPSKTAGGPIEELSGPVAGMPFSTGDVVWTYQRQVPQGWLLCVGQELNVVDYAALHRVFGFRGARFGSPSSTDTFRLPGPRHWRAWIPIDATRWTAATAYAVGALVYPVTISEYAYFEAISTSGLGVSGGAEPVWTYDGSDVVDNAGANQVVWRMRAAASAKVRT